MSESEWLDQTPGLPSVVALCPTHGLNFQVFCYNYKVYTTFCGWVRKYLEWYLYTFLCWLYCLLCTLVPVARCTKGIEIRAIMWENNAIDKNQIILYRFGTIPSRNFLAHPHIMRQSTSLTCYIWTIPKAKVWTTVLLNLWLRLRSQYTTVLYTVTVKNKCEVYSWKSKWSFPIIHPQRKFIIKMTQATVHHS